MLTHLRSFLGRYTVIELLVAFALAGGAISFVASVVNGLVYTPIQEAASSSFASGGNGPLTFVVGGRVFDTAGILISGLTLLLLLLGAAVYVHAHGGALWDEQGDVSTCPHCLSEIPSDARVCSYCTRDVATAAAPS